MSNLIYLASPYSHDDPEVRYARYDAACAATARMMQGGMIVYSPIVHCHILALKYDLPGDWEFWKRIDERMLAACDMVMVLCLDGWKDSVGVTAEIGMARDRGMQVEFMEAV